VLDRWSHIAKYLVTENNMANVYIEPRPKGRPEGDPIDDYVVEDHADHVLATFKTQPEAIEWAKRPCAPTSLGSGT
jgi:hypothetical protein